MLITRPIAVAAGIAILACAYGCAPSDPSPSVYVLHTGQGYVAKSACDFPISRAAFKEVPNDAEVVEDGPPFVLDRRATGQPVEALFLAERMPDARPGTYLGVYIWLGPEQDDVAQWIDVPSDLRVGEAAWAQGVDTEAAVRSMKGKFGCG